MVWRGINLSRYHEQKWLNKTISHLVWLLIISFIGMIIALLIWQNNQKQIEYYQQQKKDIEHIEQRLQKTKTTINQIKEKQITGKHHHLDKDTVDRFIHDISKTKLNGFIENIHFFQDTEPRIKILGYLFNEEGLDHLLSQIQQNNHQYKMDYLQKNEHNQFEFSLLLTLNYQKDKDHETKNQRKLD